MDSDKSKDLCKRRQWLSLRRQSFLRDWKHIFTKMHKELHSRIQNSNPMHITVGIMLLI